MAARGEAEAPGFSREKISFAIVLSAEGEPLDVLDLREAAGKKLHAAVLEVPAAVKRTVGICRTASGTRPPMCWGARRGEGRRTAEEHAAFKALHTCELSGGRNDEGLIALRRFLETWKPDALRRGAV